MQLNKADGLVTIQAAWLINSQMDQPMVWAYAELASGYIRAVGENQIWKSNPDSPPATIHKNVIVSATCSYKEVADTQ